MRFVGVDLAERYSAAVILDEKAELVSEHFIDAGAQEIPPNPFKNCHAVSTWCWQIPWDPDNIWAIEKPYHHARNAEPALMVTGAFIAALKAQGIEGHVIVSNTWQREMGYNRKEHGDPKKWARELAESLGYVPGTTVQGTKVLARNKKDLIDAYLIALWLKNLCLGA